MLDGLALAALNHLLQGADWARARLAPFAGRTAQLGVPPFQLALVVDAEGYFTATASETFDVRIELPAGSPVQLLGGAGALERLLKTAQVSGSVEFADALGFVLRNLRWDYEEDLSKAVGDIAAQRIAAQVKRFAAWQEEAAQRLGENLADYFTTERPALVRSEAIAAFATETQRLADELAALERRLAKLQASQPNPKSPG